MTVDSLPCFFFFIFAVFLDRRHFMRGKIEDHMIGQPGNISMNNETNVTFIWYVSKTQIVFVCPISLPPQCISTALGKPYKFNRPCIKSKYVISLRTGVFFHAAGHCMQINFPAKIAAHPLLEPPALSAYNSRS